MKRRNLLSTLGVAAAGGTLATGTGAFSSVEANREMSVAVAGDASALLRIAPSDGPNGAYATGAENGALSLDFTDSNDNVDGDGVNKDAVSYFDEVFLIENQGTQDVELSVSPLTFTEVSQGFLVVLLFPLDIPAFTGTLGVGDTVRFSVWAASFSGSAQSDIDLNEEFEITAEAI